MMEKDAKIYVAGHRGMVGQAICRELHNRGYTNIIGRTSRELDLRDQSAVQRFFQEEKPECVILAAAKVGGIMANIQAPAEFLYDNLMIEANIVHNAYRCGASKLLFLASSCIYPRNAPQPMKEEYLMTGKVEPTNEGYAIAKIAGMKLCEMYNKQYHTDFISVMPCNLYGYGDNFDPIRSHVVPALIRRFHEAKNEGASEVIIWGTGKARRELLFAEDMAQACVFLLENYSGNDFFNIGTGQDVSIAELATVIAEVVGYHGEIHFDATRPDGMPQKLLDVEKLTQYGWKCKTELRDGLQKTYDWFLQNVT